MIDRDKFLTIKFKSKGLVEASLQAACRVPKGFQGNQDQQMLRFRIGNIVQEYKARYRTV